MSEPVWLPIEEVIKINETLVRDTGERFLLRDRALLDSGLNRARNAYCYGEDDVATLGTLILFGIAKNHPFEQGNKRTAFLSFALFLEINGYMLTIANNDLLGKWVEFVIEGRLSEAEFTEMLQPYIAECAEYYGDDL